MAKIVKSGTVAFSLRPFTTEDYGTFFYIDRNSNDTPKLAEFSISLPDHIMQNYPKHLGNPIGSLIITRTRSYVEMGFSVWLGSESQARRLIAPVSIEQLKHIGFIKSNIRDQAGLNN